MFFTRRNQELASKLVSSFQWHRRWDVDVENTTLACTPLVFHFDVLLRIEIVRVWRHLLVGVPFKNWIKKKGGRGWKYAALGGRKESNVTSVWFFLCRICFICSFELEGERRTRLRRGLIIIENIVITLKLEINELNSLTERWQRNGRKLWRWIKICSSFGNWRLNDRWTVSGN